MSSHEKDNKEGRTTKENEGEILRPNWPEYGLITCENVSFAYHPSLPDVLKKLYFCIRPNEKVGIVGDSRLGKKSFLSMLFRLGTIRGKLMIDGVNLAELSLDEIKDVISIIPKNPEMFCGSLRTNLDPMQEHTESVIWNALQEVRMKTAVKKLPSKLETEITESGSYCSVGERQLLSLAKALLKKNKILIIDEAATSVTAEIASTIRKTIRDKFQHCTVITISQRLSTVMDSDRIMVFDDGKIVEFDEPLELLTNREGHFKKLVDQEELTVENRCKLSTEGVKQYRNVSPMRKDASYPGSNVTASKTKKEILEHFGTRIIFNTTV